MVVRTVELGCERGWRRAQWRTELAIPKSAPCLGILASLDPKSLESIVRALAQELRWVIPGIRIGILDAPGSGMSYPNAAGHRSSEPFQIRSMATHASQVLDWVCGADVWLNLGKGPLADAIDQVASDIRLPLKSHGATALSSLQSDSLGLAQSLIKQLQAVESPFAMLAFPVGMDTWRTSKSPMAVDEALRILQNGIYRTVETSELDTAQNKPVSVRPAA